MAKESAVMYKSFLEATRELDPDVRLQAIDAYFDYVFEGKEYEGNDPIIKALLIVIRPSLDKANNRYEAACENGKKGGRPKTRKKPEQNQNKTSSKPEPNLYEDVYEDVNEDVNDDEDVYEDDDVIPRVPAQTSPLPAHIIHDVKEKVIDEGDLSTLEEETWIRPAKIVKADPDIYVSMKQERAVIHIRDRYGGAFANAIRSVIPDFQGELIFATG